MVPPLPPPPPGGADWRETAPPIQRTRVQHGPKLKAAAAAGGDAAAVAATNATSGGDAVAAGPATLEPPAKFANRRPDWEMPSLDLDVRVSSTAPLEAAMSNLRAACPQCGRRQKFYCYDCEQPRALTATPPPVRLPFRVVCVHHSQEARSKNTGIHAVLLAPGYVTLCDTTDCAEAIGAAAAAAAAERSAAAAAGPSAPARATPTTANATPTTANANADASSKSAIATTATASASAAIIPPELLRCCAVLFPSDDAEDAATLDPSTIDVVTIIDTPWAKARALVAAPPFAGMRRVVLHGTRSAFWRFHTRKTSEEGVCTVEALLHLCRGLCAAGKLPPLQLPRGDGNNGSGGGSGSGNGGGEVVAAAAAASGGRCYLHSSSSGGGGGGGEGEGGAPAAADGATAGAVACHCFDDLLWYFVHQHSVVQRAAAKRAAQRQKKFEEKPRQQQQGQQGQQPMDETVAPAAAAGGGGGDEPQAKRSKSDG